MVGRLLTRVTMSVAVMAVGVVPMIGASPPGSGAMAHAATAASGDTLPPSLRGTTYAADFPDPTAVYAGPDTGYLAFGTNLWGWGWVPVLQSWDLETWTPYADALPVLPTWATSDGVWAPGVAQIGDRWVLFYAAKDRDSGQHCIAAATSDRPEGPYDPEARPVLCAPELGGVIDPHPFRDRDGRWYLHYKTEGVPGWPSMIWGMELDGTRVVGTPSLLLFTEEAWEEPRIENPAMVVVRGQRWLLYSASRWDTDEYTEAAATCAGPLGPCRRRGDRLLATGGGVAGPGGAAPFIDAAGELRVVYHAWDDSRVGYTAWGQRQLHTGHLVSRRAGLAVVGAGGVEAGDSSAVATASSPTGAGYWTASADGTVTAFGGATPLGDVHDAPLPHPVVGMAATPSGNGYWLVAEDGGIFAFGDATFHGSTGGTPLNQRIVGMAATPSGNGYWLVAEDGGIFAFGDATFHGSLAGTGCRRTSAIGATVTGSGYRLVGCGDVAAFGDAASHGSA